MAKDNKKRGIVMSKLSNVKLKSAGIKTKKNSDLCCDSSIGDIRYPSLWLDTKNTPDLVGKDVEDVVILVIEAKITGHSLNENSKSDKKESYDLQIKKIGVA